MTSDLLVLAGGVGLFLMGMQVMTDALRQLASRQMRTILARFTTSPLTGTLTGALTTAVIQSSSATMVTVIGFVGAGLMTFPRALGVIYGANIGTTMTGWVVALVGLKLSIGVVALPLLLLAVLMRTVTSGTWARAALALAGFSLIFIGLEMMQEAAEGFEALLSAENLPGNTFLGRLWLVAAGAVITIVIQSSSAGVAAALVLVSSGALSLEQAAAMVIGMNVGTTFTALLATLGGSRDMYRTAVAHLAYNVVSAVAAFAVLTVLVAAIRSAIGDDPALSLVIFHTIFNVLGALIMLPLTASFARLIERLIPSQEASLTQSLNEGLLGDPSAAMDAAQASTDAIAQALFAALGRTLSPGHAATPLASEVLRVEPALDDLREYLARISTSEDRPRMLSRYSALLHQVDHLGRLAGQMTREERMQTLNEHPVLKRPSMALGAAARRVAFSERDVTAAQMARLSSVIAGRAGKLRRSALLREQIGLVSVSAVFDLTDAMRWLQRTAHNLARVLHYRDVAASEESPPVSADRPQGNAIQNEPDPKQR